MVIASLLKIQWTFLAGLYIRKIRVRAASAFLQEKTSWKRKRENNKSKEKRMYRNRGCEERETTRRERRMGRCPYCLIHGSLARGRKMIKRDRAIRRGCSLSPRIVRRCRCFSLFLYLIVPFPNFTLQIPLLTLTKVDAVVIHLANLLQLHYKEEESLRNF